MTSILFNRQSKVSGISRKLTSYYQNLMQYFYEMTGNSSSKTQFTQNEIVNEEGLSLISDGDIYFNGVKFPKTYQSDQILYVISTTEIGYGTSLTIPGIFITGEVIYTAFGTTPSGWIPLNDGTIGNAASLATTRANADTEDLYTQLWTLISNTYCPVSGGRGASAAADFAAGKTINLPRCAGRILGNQGAGSGLSARSIGEYLGTQTHTLANDEMPEHVHGADMGDLGDPVYFRTRAFDVGTGLPVTVTDYGEGSEFLHTYTLGNAGSSAAHNNMQPSTFLNAYIKL